MYLAETLDYRASMVAIGIEPMPDTAQDCGPELMSTLEQLLQDAKSAGAAARENCTTGALAGAIRTKPGPFVVLLREAGLLPPDPVADLAVETQAPLSDTGIIDLVVVAHAGDQRLADRIWDLRRDRVAARLSPPQ